MAGANVKFIYAVGDIFDHWLSRRKRSSPAEHANAMLQATKWKNKIVNSEIGGHWLHILRVASKQIDIETAEKKKNQDDSDYESPKNSPTNNDDEDYDPMVEKHNARGKSKSRSLSQSKGGKKHSRSKSPSAAPIDMPPRKKHKHN